MQSQSFDKPIRLLMVSTEYPPIRGGVGRYTENLTKSLEKLGVDVFVLCNEKGKGDYHGLSPANRNNSEVVTKAALDSKADIVHVQYEHGLYGLTLNPLNPKKISTNIDSFYHDSNIPIITTLHSAYTFKQWMSLATLMQSSSKFGRYTKLIGNYWKRLLNYRSFLNSDREKVAISRATIVLSHHMSSLVNMYGYHVGIDDGKLDIIYHGAQPSSKLTSQPTKKQARSRFSLPDNKRIALAVGFRIVTKGWDIIKKMHIPDDWVIVVNSSRNDYSNDNINLQFKERHNDSIIDLHKDFLEEEELSSLFFAADATILPYTVSSSSGVMFDGLAHGLPFVASDLGFFREFSLKGLGITVKRRQDAFVDGLVTLAKEYETYRKHVYEFKEKLKWDVIAKQHVAVYKRILSLEKPPAACSHSTIVANVASTT